MPWATPHCNHILNHKSVSWPWIYISNLRLRCSVCPCNMRVMHGWVTYSWLRPWLPKFLLYTVCYLIIVRCGQGGLKSFCKENKRLARNEVMDWVKNGVWRDKWLYTSSSRAQRAKMSLSCPQASPKVVRSGERTRIEALLVARFDAEDLADERSTSVAQYKTARNKCQRNRDFLQ